MLKETRRMVTIILACALLFNLISLIPPVISKASGASSQIWIKQSTIALTDIAYGNGIYVALTNDDSFPQIVTSTDLVHWTEQRPISNQTHIIEFINNQFVIGTSHHDDTLEESTFLFSPDGVTWTGTTIDHPAQLSITSIAYGNGLYVATSLLGEITTSTDGMKWTAPVKVLDELKQITFVNEHFVALGTKKRMPGMLEGDDAFVTSTDGEKWNTTRLLNTEMFSGLELSMATNGKTIVTAGYFAGHRFSANGLNKTVIPVEEINQLHRNFFITKISHVDVEGGLFVAVGEKGGILTSTDTSSWKDESIARNNAKFFNIIQGNNKIVAVGEDGVYVRLGEETEKTDSILINQSTTDFSAIAYGNGIYVAITNNNDLSEIMTSTNLIDWVEQPPISNQKQSYNTIQFIDGQFVMGASYADHSNEESTFLFSTDGVTWTEKTVNPPSELSIRSITFGNDLYVATSATGEITTSTDGVAWTSPVTVLDGFNQITFIDGHFVALGSKQDISDITDKAAIFAISTDGVTWKTTLQPNTTMFSEQLTINTSEKRDQILPLAQQNLWLRRWIM